MIVKLQRELASGGQQVLVYNRSRKRLALVPMVPTLQRRFGDRLKIYCAARIVDDDMIIGAMVPDQRW